jgi:hypothetical protein
MRINADQEEKMLRTPSRLFREPQDADKRAELIDIWQLFTYGEGHCAPRGGDRMSRIIDSLRAGATPQAATVPTFGTVWTVEQ